MKGCYDWRRWAGRRDLTIGEFEDIWNANNRYEVARGLLLALPETEGISRKDKVEFLVDLVLETREIDTASEKWRLRDLGTDPDKLSTNMLKPALQTFFEMVPVWDKELEKCCRTMLISLLYLSAGSLEGLGSKIKKFVHSYLDTHKKEEMDENAVAQVLVKNRMFEELVNYDFNDLYAIDKLWLHIFGVGYPSTTSMVATSHMTLKESYQLRARNLVKAWGENKDPHALSTLYRLLAKQGDLNKIFQLEI